MEKGVSISGILRQKRAPGKNGECRDSARCYIVDGCRKKYFYLGLYGSPEVEARYQRIKRCWNALSQEDKQKLQEWEAVFSQVGSTAPYVRASYTPSKITKPSNLANCLHAYQQEFFGEKLSRDEAHDRDAVSYFFECFPAPPEFSMSILGEFVSYLVRIAPEVRQGVNRAGQKFWKKKEWGRYTVNRLVKSFKKILAWGINNGYLSPVFREAVRLYPGITSANPRGLSDSPKRVDCRDSDVTATLPYLSPVIAAMVKVQRGACLRPSEICDLRVGDIVFDESGIAVVNKEKHKIARTGVHRQISFGLAETSILRQFCEGKEPGDFVFSQRQHLVWYVQRSRKNGKNNNVSEKYLSRFSEGFTTEVYDRNVRRACERAKKDNPAIEYWTPYQLRHASYSAISAQYGYDVASKVAGHLSPNLARVYDHSAAVVSQRIAAERQVGWWEE